MWLFALFLAIPLIEIGLFIQVGGAIGLWPTLGIVILTAVMGTWLIRAQGMLAMNQVRASFSELSDPTEPLAHGAMILVAGALLLTPGFFTDAVGFLLLIPPVRSWVYKYLSSRVKTQHFAVGSQSSASNKQGAVIDGEYSEIDQSTEEHDPKTSGWTRH